MKAGLIMSKIFTIVRLRAFLRIPKSLHSHAAITAILSAYDLLAVIRLFCRLVNVVDKA